MPGIVSNAGQRSIHFGSLWSRAERAESRRRRDTAEGNVNNTYNVDNVSRATAIHICPAAYGIPMWKTEVIHDLAQPAKRPCNHKCDIENVRLMVANRIRVTAALAHRCERTYVVARSVGIVVRRPRVTRIDAWRTGLQSEIAAHCIVVHGRENDVVRSTGILIVIREIAIHTVVVRVREISVQAECR